MLTQRQNDICALLAAGLTGNQIGRRWKLSRWTINQECARIREHYGADTTLEAVVKWSHETPRPR